MSTKNVPYPVSDTQCVWGSETDIAALHALIIRRRSEGRAMGLAERADEIQRLREWIRAVIEEAPASALPDYLDLNILDPGPEARGETRLLELAG